MESPTRKMLKAESLPPFVPNRFREPIYHVENDLLEAEAVGKIGRWLYENRDKLARGGDEHGAQRFNFEIIDVDTVMPTELLAPFRKALIAKATDPEILAKLCVPEFDVRYLETHATLYHHGSHFVWHDDAPGYGGQLMPTRRVTFCYYMHAEPQRFSGGELEFLDGTAIAPLNNRLVLFHPIQQHRVKRVECWSAHILDGRWALMGWVHGDAPEGWAERIPKLRGTPQAQ